MNIQQCCVCTMYIFRPALVPKTVASELEANYFFLSLSLSRKSIDVFHWNLKAKSRNVLHRKYINGENSVWIKTTFSLT